MEEIFRELFHRIRLAARLSNLLRSRYRRSTTRSALDTPRELCTICHLDSCDGTEFHDGRNRT